MSALDSDWQGNTGVSARVHTARHFFRQPDLYLESNYRIPLRARLVRELVGELKDSRVLDLGCGDGSISAQFLPLGNQVTMVDYSPEMLERARRRVPARYASQVEYVNSDITGFIPSQRYDLVLCIGVLAHVDSVEEVIEKIAGFVKPGGRVVFQISDAGRAAVKLSNWFHATIAAVGGRTLRCKGMTLPDVLAIARGRGLAPGTPRRHLLLLPGMARLLGRWLVPYDLFVQKHPVLARHGSNVVFLCTRRTRQADIDANAGTRG